MLGASREALRAARWSHRNNQRVVSKHRMERRMPPPSPGGTMPRQSSRRRPIGVVLPAFVALVVLGGILNACGESTEETAASPTPEPSVAATETVSEPEEPVEPLEVVIVPRVVGKRLENAKDALRRADLQVTVVRKHSSKPAGTVLMQSVSVGTEVRPGRTIRLVASKGPKP